MAEHKTGDKVRYRDMTMPAEVLSGPHKTTGERLRYLIRKADGNVSLVVDTDLTKIVPRLDQVAGTLAMQIYGRPFVALEKWAQVKVARTALQVLDIADRTHDQA